MGIFKKKDFTIDSTGIDRVDEVVLGGVKQSILIQAVDPTKPVLLFVHGGPCLPIPGVVSRGQDYAVCITTRELVKHFVLVFWDQRGAGKSFNGAIPAASFRVERFIEDCNELVNVLRERFKQEKVFLAAHSWGTVIGLSMAARYPEKLHAYVGISQLLNWAANDQFCYEWLRAAAEQKKDRKTLSKLAELGLPPYVKAAKQWTDFRGLLTKYQSISRADIINVFKLFLRSGEYTLRDIFHAFYSSFKLTYTQGLVEDFAKIDLESIAKVEVPVFFLHGKQDFHLDGRPVERFAARLRAPRKELRWFEKSSHAFCLEDARQIEGFIIRMAE